MQSGMRVSLDCSPGSPGRGPNSFQLIVSPPPGRWLACTLEALTIVSTRLHRRASGRPCGLEDGQDRTLRVEPRQSDVGLRGKTKYNDSEQMWGEVAVVESALGHGDASTRPLNRPTPNMPV